MQSNGIVGVAGDDEYARAHVAAREPQRNVISGGYAQLLRGYRADHRGVIPGDARDGLGSLLQPARIRELAVANRRIGTKNDFQRVGVAVTQTARRPQNRHAAKRKSREARAGDHAIVQRRFPYGFESLVLFRPLALPIALNDIVSGPARIASDERKDFVRRMIVVQRRDQRLHDAGRAVVARPSLQDSR